jgi:hypothetical protein
MASDPQSLRTVQTTSGYRQEHDPRSPAGLPLEECRLSWLNVDDIATAGCHQLQCQAIRQVFPQLSHAFSAASSLLSDRQQATAMLVWFGIIAGRLAGASEEALDTVQELALDRAASLLPEG